MHLKAVFLDTNNARVSIEQHQGDGRINLFFTNLFFTLYVLLIIFFLLNLVFTLIYFLLLHQLLLDPIAENTHETEQAEHLGKHPLVRSSNIIYQTKLFFCWGGGTLFLRKIYLKKFNIKNIVEDTHETEQAEHLGKDPLVRSSKIIYQTKLFFCWGGGLYF